MLFKGQLQLRSQIGYGHLMAFSFPSILASLLEPLASVVDTALVGRLNTEWLGALALGTTILSTFTWMFNFLLHASTHSLSEVDEHTRFDSPEKRWREVGDRVKLSLLFALVVGLLAVLFLLLFKAPLYQLVGVESRLKPLVDDYFLVRLYGHPLALVYATLLSILRGLGNVRLSFYLVSLTTGLNVLLTWFFLYPLEWGLAGAAWGTVLSSVFGILLCFGWFLASGQRRRGLFQKTWAPTHQWFRFGKNSGNLFGRSFFLSGSLFLATRVASEVGVKPLAAHQILLQVWLFASFFTDGVAISGNVLGARLASRYKWRRLRLMFARLLVLGTALGACFCFVYFFGGDWIARLFTSDSEVLAILSQIWVWVAISQIPNAVAFVYDGLLFGLEGFSHLRKHMMIGVLLFILPFAYYAWSAQELLPLWWGLILLNVYRLVSGFYGVEKFIHLLRSTREQR